MVVSNVDEITCLEYFKFIINRYMLEQNHPDPHHFSSFNRLDNSLSHLSVSPHHESTLRRRVHQLMSQNFELKQTIASLQQQLKGVQQINSSMRMQLRSALQQISVNDELIEKARHRQEQLLMCQREVQEELIRVKEEFQEQREAFDRMLELNRNLETENSLISQIKNKYQVELSKLKLEIQHIKSASESIKSQKSNLQFQFSKLLQQTQCYSVELSSKQNQMREYEAYVLQKLAEARNDPQFHEKCLAEKDKYYCKYLKYKQKACLLRKEKDQLVRQIQAVNAEIGSQSMRKYLDN